MYYLSQHIFSDGLSRGNKSKSNQMFLTLAETEGSVAPGPSVSSFQFLGARESDRGVTAETPWPNFLRPGADLLHYQLSHLTTII